MSEFLEVAKQAALGAGQLILEHSHDSHMVEQKGIFDFVTEVDRLSESYIRTRISNAFPNHHFFCEEQVSSSLVAEEELLKRMNGYTWIVDALDGTTNFIRGIPQFAVSIALAKDNELIVGVVYDPSRDELFAAEKGRGASLNGEGIHVSRTESLASSIVAMGFPAADMAKRADTMQRLQRISMQLGSLRVYNCAALLLCYVAAGRLDASFEQGLHLWDMAAGTLLVKEADGDVTYLDGKPFDFLARENLAGNKPLRALLQS